MDNNTREAIVNTGISVVIVAFFAACVLAQKTCTDYNTAIEKLQPAIIREKADSCARVCAPKGVHQQRLLECTCN